MNATTIQPNPTANQIFGKHVATIVKGSTGVRGVKIIGGRFGRSGFVMPLDMVPLLADKKDQWIKDVLVRCGDCREIVKAGTLDCDMCPDCYEKAGEENAAADRS